MSLIHPGRYMWRASAVILLLLAGLSTLHAAERVPLAIDTRAGARALAVELAATAEQRARGLMQRESLAEHAGMLFVYGGREQPASSGYWMYRTLIPLDIAFIGRDGRIRAIFTMPPCASRNPRDCPSYSPEQPYVAALEMAGGYFADHSIAVGDRITQGRELLFE